MTNMSYIYAALILHEENKDITPENIVSILKAAGIENVDEAFARAVSSALSKVDIETIKSKAILMPSQAPTPVEQKPEKEEKKEEKKEKKKEEKKEEETFTGLAALFG
ncbi:MAG: 50S ribosomal protein L12 [Candidatus Njordarchaeia archaeon]